MKKLIFACLFGIISAAQAAAPTVTLSITPLSGRRSVTPTITWSSSGAVSCSASSPDSLWNGAVALSGTKKLSTISTTKNTKTVTYNLTCVSGSDLTATLNWNAPIQNTDGSTLTDLTSYKIYEVTTSPVLLNTVPSIVTSAYISGLSVGTHTYYVTAINSAGVESAPSNYGSKYTYGASSTTKSVTVTVTR